MHERNQWAPNGQSGYSPKNYIATKLFCLGSRGHFSRGCIKEEGSDCFPKMHTAVVTWERCNQHIIKKYNLKQNGGHRSPHTLRDPFGEFTLSWPFRKGYNPWSKLIVTCQADSTTYLPWSQEVLGKLVKKAKMSDHSISNKTLRNKTEEWPIYRCKTPNLWHFTSLKSRTPGIHKVAVSVPVNIKKIVHTRKHEHLLNIKFIQIHLKDIGRINIFADGTLKELPHCEDDHFWGGHCCLPPFLYGKLFWNPDNLFLTFKLYIFFSLSTVWL